MGGLRHLERGSRHTRRPRGRRAGRLSVSQEPRRIHLGVRRRGGARHHARPGVRAVRQLHERRRARRADDDALGRGVSDDIHRGPGIPRTGDAPRDDIRASPEPRMVLHFKKIEAYEPQAGLHLLPLFRPLLLRTRRGERLSGGQPLVRSNARRISRERRAHRRVRGDHRAVADVGKGGVGVVAFARRSGESAAFFRFALKVQKKLYGCSDKFFIDPKTGTKI